jgi:hypothetical protein
MEPTKRMAIGGNWDRLPEEIISLIAVKVAETLEDPFKDLRSLRLCNKAMKRASSSHTIANHFNLKHYYRSMVWEGVGALDTYLQTVDWLQGEKSGGALSINGMGDICTGRTGGATLLTRAEEEGHLQASCVLVILKYYSTAQPMMFSTTSSASTAKSLLIHRSKHGGGWRTGTMTRMMHWLWLFTIEFWRRYVM